MKKNYRNAKFDKQSNGYHLPSVSDIWFSAKKSNLIIDIDWDILPQNLERVNILLINCKILKNVFVVNSKFFFYLNNRIIFDYEDIREEYMIQPEENILDFYSFDKEDIICIYSDNIPSNPWYNFIGYWHNYLGHDPLDSKCAIRYNMNTSIKSIKYPVSINKNDLLFVKNDLTNKKIFNIIN